MITFDYVLTEVTTRYLKFTEYSSEKRPLFFFLLD
jgi:hypothetical protein